MRRLCTILVATVTLGACGQDAEMPAGPTDEPRFSSQAATGPAASATYEVRITNLTPNQPLTPPLGVIHRSPVRLFQVGEPASVGVQQIAENGNLMPMLDALGASAHAADVVVAAGDPVPPLLPGEERVFTIVADRGARLFSFAAMLICTNDGFTGLHGVRLPRDVGASVTFETNAYDAGTEVNTEDFDNLVPPCGPLTGVDTGGAGTGTSDPSLAESGVVHPHPGIAGDADLEPGVHGWTDPVARARITRIG
jgi:hypothetical protein